MAAGDLAGAKEHLQTATKLDPKLARPHNYLGKVFMGEGNIPSAITEFEEALHLHPDFPEAEENLHMAKASGSDSLTLSPPGKKFHDPSLGESHECCSHRPVAGLRGATFSQHLDGPQGRGYS